MRWKLIGNGSFNWVYRNGEDGEGDLVLKIIIENKPLLRTEAIDTMDNYARSVRVWNEINPDSDPPARIEEVILDGRKEIGWVCPFIKGTKPSDKEVSQTLIDIFNRTGRIIVDATSRNNFIKTPEGKTVCIDIGMAVQLEARDEACLIGLRRRSSFSSLDTWQEMSHTYTNWFENEPSHQQVPETIQTVKALLFIKNHRPDITDVNFLMTNPQALTVLAKAYDMEYVPDIRQPPSDTDRNDAVIAAQQLLVTEHNLTLEAIKHYCREKLSKVLSHASSPKQPQDLTTFNTRHALELLRQVNQCQNLNDIQHVCDEIASIEEVIEAETSLFVSAPMQQVAIRQVHHSLLTELEHIDDLSVSKQNCLHILTQFLAQHGKMEPHELSVLQSQFSSSPKEKVQYYKKQITNQKLSDREKEVLQLIKWIDNATTFAEIDEFIVKFEASLPKPREPSKLSLLERIYACFTRPSLEDRLQQSLAQCKLAVATAKLAMEKQPTIQVNTPSGDNA